MSDRLLALVDRLTEAVAGRGQANGHATRAEQEAIECRRLMVEAEKLAAVAETSLRYHKETIERLHREASHPPASGADHQYRLAFQVIVDTDGEFSADASEAMQRRFREALERVPVADLVRCTDLAVEALRPQSEVWS